MSTKQISKNDFAARFYSKEALNQVCKTQNALHFNARQ